MARIARCAMARDRSAPRLIRRVGDQLFPGSLPFRQPLERIGKRAQLLGTAEIEAQLASEPPQRLRRVPVTGRIFLWFLVHRWLRVDQNTLLQSEQGLGSRSSRFQAGLRRGQTFYRWLSGCDASLLASP